MKATCRRLDTVEEARRAPFAMERVVHAMHRMRRGAVVRTATTNEVVGFVVRIAVALAFTVSGVGGRRGREGVSGY